MSYGDAKVYFDGGHYIAIPHVEQSHKKRKRITIETNQVLNESKISNESIAVKNDKEVMATAKIDLEVLFETLYKENLDKKPRERNEKIIESLEKYIESKEKLNEFVKVNLERKKRNLIERRKRFARKVYLQEWSYFCTFTYDDKKIKSSEFKKKLSKCFQNFSTRKGWKYIGVWEKAPVTKRLHFHGVFYIPEGTMPGVLEESKSFDFKRKDMKKFNINSFFEKRFGMNDFIEIKSNVDLKEELVYLTKYLEKSNEKIVYSRGLNTYIVSDIQKSDIACNTGQSGKKLVLYDDFTLWDVGELIGKVSKENINKMPKAN